MQTVAEYQREVRLGFQDWPTQLTEIVDQPFVEYEEGIRCNEIFAGKNIFEVAKGDLLEVLELFWIMADGVFLQLVPAFLAACFDDIDGQMTLLNNIEVVLERGNLRHCFSSPQRSIIRKGFASLEAALPFTQSSVEVMISSLPKCT